VWTRATTITLPNPGSEERGKEVGWVKSNISGKQDLLRDSIKIDIDGQANSR